MKNKGGCFTVFIVLLSYVSGLTTASSFTTANNPETIQQECQLTFGWANWPPLQYFDDHGEIAGVQIDLVKTLSKEIDCKIIYVEKNWSDIVNLVRDGKIDFTANATLSKERKKFAYFSKPYRRDSYAIWVKTEDFDKFNFNTVEELKKSGVKIGLTSGHLYSAAIDKWINDPVYSKNISYSPSSSITMQRLISGEIEASLEDPFIVAYKRRTKLVTADISRLPINIFGHNVSFMFSKKTIKKSFVDKFDKALKKLQESPDFSNIWLDPQFIQD